MLSPFLSVGAFTVKGRSCGYTLASHIIRGVMNDYLAGSYLRLHQQYKLLRRRPEYGAGPQFESMGLTKSYQGKERVCMPES